MTAIEIIPARKRGHAQLRLAKGALPDPTATVTVVDRYKERGLGQSDGSQAVWNGKGHAFGPYAVEADSDGRPFVEIGPEIANWLEEYQRLRLTVGATTADVVWPETIERAAAATHGARIAGAAAAAPKPAPAAKSEAPPQAAPAFEPSSLVAPARDPAETPVSPGRRWLYWGIGSAVALSLIVAGLLVSAPHWKPQFDDLLTSIWPDRPDTDTDTGTSPASASTSCAALAPDGLAADPRGAIEALLAQSAQGGCTGGVDATLALRHLQTAATQGSGEALAMFGGLYDPTHRDPLLNDQLALTLSDDVSLALDYYTRAEAAGAAEVRTAITELCASIAGATDPRAAEAEREFCE